MSYTLFEKVESSHQVWPAGVAVRFVEISVSCPYQKHGATNVEKREGFRDCSRDSGARGTKFFGQIQLTKIELSGVGESIASYKLDDGRETIPSAQAL
jgi:hypothetical protein